jgi:hypothetical protein
LVEEGVIIGIWYRWAIGAAARERALSHYAAGAMVRRIESVYDRVIDRRAGV